MLKFLKSLLCTYSCPECGDPMWEYEEYLCNHHRCARGCGTLRAIAAFGILAGFEWNGKPLPKNKIKEIIK